MSDDNRSMQERLIRRQQQLQAKQQEAEKLRQQREQLEVQFQAANRIRSFLQVFHPTNMKRTLRTIGAYILGRRNRRQLYSRTYKQKQASNDILPYVRALYTKGFTQKALNDLRKMYEITKNKYLQDAIAWELALWHARLLNHHHAKEALKYLQTMNLKHLQPADKRKRVIIKAECYLALGKLEAAQQTINNLLLTDNHPDLYLALANCQTSSEKKFKWINEVFRHYSLTQFTTSKTIKHYDDLIMETSKKVVDSTKVSVILPAYNSEDGIKTAIESLLKQTWQNLELLIIDDCSTDGTLEVIQQYAKKDKRLRVFQTKKNSGPYVARNIGLKQATGEFVTVNDADDWSHPEKLALQAKHLLTHENVIANTSEQARLLEDLTFYRRGTPGKYIFSNMSSLMFRREIVLEKLGFWDEVRFAADGEFKRRLVKVFGKEAVIDLKTGPLSFPRQSKHSLTASSAFGYDGFFMGARREYVASFTHYHQTTDDLYYPAKQTQRLFPVPEPMLPERQLTMRTFDIAIAADFYEINDEAAHLIVEEIETNKRLHLTTALIQMNQYTLKRHGNEFHPEVRQQIDGKNVQVVVYGEEITCKLLIVRTPLILQERQKYLPKINTIATLIMIDELPVLEYNGKKVTNYNVRQCLRHLMIYTNKRGRWYPLNEQMRQPIEKRFSHDFRFIKLATENWVKTREQHDEHYAKRIEDWLIDE